MQQIYNPFKGLIQKVITFQTSTAQDKSNPTKKDISISANITKELKTQKQINQKLKLEIKQKDSQLQTLTKKNIQLQQKNKQLQKMYLIQQSKRKIFQNNYNPNLYVKLSPFQTIKKFVSDKIISNGIKKSKMSMSIQNGVLFGYGIYIICICIIFGINFSSLKKIQVYDILAVPIALFLQYLFLQEIFIKYPIQQKYIAYAIILKVIFVFFLSYVFASFKIILVPFLLEIQVFILSLSMKLEKQQPQLKKNLTMWFSVIVFVFGCINFQHFYQQLISYNGIPVFKTLFIAVIILGPITYFIERSIKKLKIWKCNTKLALMLISFTYLIILDNDKLQYLLGDKKYIYQISLFGSIYVCLYWPWLYFFSK